MAWATGFGWHGTCARCCTAGRGTGIAPVPARAYHLNTHTPMPVRSPAERNSHSLSTGTPPAGGSPVTVPEHPETSLGPPRKPPVTAPPAVIIVEGDTTLAEMLEYAVRNAGHDTRSFRNGQFAIDFLLRQIPPSQRPVVLLDLDLLGTEGFLALKQVADAQPGIRIIVLSAQGAERDHIRALRAGAIDYLVKPLSIPVLIAKVERLLNDRDR